MKRGLVFGKFLPLHRGHQLMIETALSQVDDLTIVVYDSHRPDDDRMPVGLRLCWLRELYPHVESILSLVDRRRRTKSSQRRRDKARFQS